MAFAPVHVLEAHDVVLAQVVPGLNFDHFQEIGPWVFQTVFDVNRDVGRLIRLQIEHLVATGNPRR